MAIKTLVPRATPKPQSLPAAEKSPKPQAPVRANAAPAVAPVKAAPSAATVAGLVKLGFAKDIAEKIAAQSPTFLTLYQNFVAENPGYAPEQGEPYTLPEIVTVYRGLRLNSASEFNPNWGMFDDAANHDFGGSIYVSTNKEVTKEYGNYMAVFQFPKALLSHGKCADYYVASTPDFEALGIHDLSALLKGIGKSVE
jgi:hypothetical protein